MKRRDFLRATLVTVGTLAVPGCSDDDSSSSSTGGATCTPVVAESYFPQSVASGDPKSDSVIVWTRVEGGDGDLDVELEVALDEAFVEPFLIEGATRAKLKAEAAFDHCVKVRLTGLAPATTYYYRFLYSSGGACNASKTGKTKTAPAADADVTVRFAYVSCQDFIGRYYNNYRALAAEPDLDFFVHLGDYIYETTGDPTFQETAGDRKVVFTDQAGAIELTSGDGKTYYAAKSLDNYRELYRTYRGDPALQAVHETLPMIATWDDHEFSDDSHGAVATYFDGKQDETDVDRRKAANKAWFEYMPVDYQGAPDFVYDEAAAYPDDIKIYRDFRFGKNVHLVMTDLRTYRADHLIPEDAFPGEVVLDQAALVAATGAVPPEARPYVDIDTFAGGAYKTALVAAAGAAGYDAASIQGKMSVLFINSVVAQVSDPIGPVDETAAGVELGLAYIDLGKNGYNASIGSRYLVVKDTFDIYARVTFDSTGGANQEVMGAAQESWFLDTMSNSTATWKVWGTEYCLSQLAIDVSEFPIPDSLKHQFYMNVDAWDGFRDNRSALIGQLADIGGVVAVTGDIHAFYAGTPTTNDGTKKIVEMVGSSISSGTFKSLLTKQVAADPVLSTIPLAAQLAGQIDTLLSTVANPQLGFANSGSNGFVIAEASADEFVTTFHVLAEKEVFVDYADKAAELAALYTTARFKTVAGGAELYQELEGVWLRWDSATRTYV